MNFLEELTAEWYSYEGYFVRKNVKFNKQVKGGWENELDVLAYSLSTRELIHIECSGDAESWSSLKKRFLTKKFVLSESDYGQILGTQFGTLRKIALVGFGRSTKSDLNWGPGIEVMLISQFITNIGEVLSNKDPMQEIVPEGFPRLRAMQLALAYGRGHFAGSA